MNHSLLRNVEKEKSRKQNKTRSWCGAGVVDGKGQPRNNRVKVVGVPGAVWLAEWGPSSHIFTALL